jgi:hypothetical protein
MAVLLGAASSTAPGAVQLPKRYYLALGDSIAYGFQPKANATRASAFRGYVEVFAARLRKLSPQIEVVNYGCPGESSVTFALGRCPTLPGVKLHNRYRGPQLKAAVSFLRAHSGQVSPITLTLWGAQRGEAKRTLAGSPGDGTPHGMSRRSVGVVAARTSTRTTRTTPTTIPATT